MKADVVVFLLLLPNDSLTKPTDDDEMKNSHLEYCCIIVPHSRLSIQSIF